MCLVSIVMYELGRKTCWCQKTWLQCKFIIHLQMVNASQIRQSYLACPWCQVLDSLKSIKKPLQTPTSLNTEQNVLCAVNYWVPRAWNHQNNSATVFGCHLINVQIWVLQQCHVENHCARNPFPGVYFPESELHQWEFN